MPEVGDNVSVHSKAGPRLGVVTASSGSMLRVHWETGEESSIVPGPGTLTVVGKARGKRLAKAAATTKKARRASTTARATKPTTATTPTSTSPLAKKRPEPKPSPKETGAPNEASAAAARKAKTKRTSLDRKGGNRPR